MSGCGYSVNSVGVTVIAFVYMVGCALVVGG